MIHLTEEMLADLSDPVALSMRKTKTDVAFQRTSCLKSYAIAGRTPLVDTPAWDPDDDPISGSLESF